MKNLVKVMAMSAMMLSGMAVASGPTLYGKIHMSVDVMDNGGSSSDGNKYNETAVNSNQSRIGVKGSEDIGNGMKVGYLIEWEVDMDGDSNDMGVRNRAVTLSGDWGTALLGKWDTPMKTLGRKVDLFGDQVGDLRNMTMVKIGGQNISTIDNRWDNSIQYATPNMSGFKGVVAYSTDTNTDNQSDIGDNQDNDGYSLSATYDRGAGYMVGVAYEHTDANGIDSVNLGGTPFNSDDQKAWRIAGSYMPTADIDLIASYTDIENAGFVKNFDADISTVGASYQMGNNKLKIQYAVRDVNAGGSLGDDYDSDMVTVGVDHSLSKRTEVYVAYSMTDNDHNSNSTPWLASHDSKAIGALGENADVVSFGIIHKF